MKNMLTLSEQQKIRTLVMESNGLLTEGRLSDISNYIKRILSPKKIEEVKQGITQNLNIDENSSKEDIENAILKKTDGETKLSLVKKVLQEVLGFGTFWAVWEITNNILGSAIRLSDFNPVAILSVVIFVIFRTTEAYEKGRRKILGPKIDKFIYGKKTHLGDYDTDMQESQKSKKIIRLTENDIEKLVRRVIKEEGEQQPNQPKEKSLVLLKTNNGELSTVDGIVRAIQQAKMAFEDLCNSKLTGKDGYSKEIDGIVNDFTKLEDKVRKSKETIGTFVQQKSKQDNMAYMKQRQMDYMRKRDEAEKTGRYYA